MSHHLQTRRRSTVRRVAAPLLAALIALPVATAAAADDGRASVTRGSGGSDSSTRSGGSSGSGSVSRGSSSGRAVVTRPGGGSASDGRTPVRGQVHRPHRGGISIGFWGHYPYWWSPWGYGYWGGYWAPYSYGYPYPYPVVHSRVPEYGMGALDLGVRPKKAEVYVNGQYVGLARQYDGFPGYLWLESGTYEVAFYLPGHETVVREFEIFTGLVLDVDIELRPGEAVLPTRSAPAARRPAPPARGAEPLRPEAPAGRAPAPASEPSRLRLSVEPADASIYLDGAFVGTAGEIAGLREGLRVEPGPHVLEVVRPGLVPESVHFEAVPGEEAVVQVALRAGSAA